MQEIHDNTGAAHPSSSKITKHRILIAAALVVGLGLIYWAWTSDVFSFLFLYFVLPFLVPLGLVMVLDGILLALVFKGFWRRWLEFYLLLTLWFGQTAILIAWTVRITASDAFRTIPEGCLIGAWNLYGLVIDSQFQQVFMTAFWLAAAGILGITAVTSLVRVVFLLVRRKRRQHGTGWRILTAVVTLFVLARMLGDVREFHRMGASLADSTSPDGRLRVRLVPINAFLHVNGVVMFGQAGSLWWYPMDTVGDKLTPPRGDVSFVWDSHIQVRLLVDGEPCGTYDLTSGMNISRFRKKGAPTATYPAINGLPATQPGS